MERPAALAGLGESSPVPRAGDVREVTELPLSGDLVSAATDMHAGPGYRHAVRTGTVIAFAAVWPLAVTLRSEIRDEGGLDRVTDDPGATKDDDPERGQAGELGLRGVVEGQVRIGQEDRALDRPGGGRSGERVREVERIGDIDDRDPRAEGSGADGGGGREAVGARQTSDRLILTRVV